MGRGIANDFCKKFLTLKSYCRYWSKDKDVGDVIVFKQGDIYVFNLITKYRHHHKPTYGSLVKSLHSMKLAAKENNITAISIPKVGCGLDKLDWDNVRAIIENIFIDSDITIDVFVL